MNLMGCQCKDRKTAVTRDPLADLDLELGSLTMDHLKEVLLRQVRGEFK